MALFESVVFFIVWLVCFVLTTVVSIFFRVRFKNKKRAKAVLIIGALSGLLFCTITMIGSLTCKCSLGLSCGHLETALVSFLGSIINAIILIAVIIASLYRKVKALFAHD
jgi:TctA family transporter